MKMVKSLLLGSAAGLVAVAGAQAADLPVKAKPVQYVKICSLYGVGFYYIPGTDMCIKIGGWVRAEYTWGGNGSIGVGALPDDQRQQPVDEQQRVACSRLHHGRCAQPDRIRHGARLHRRRRQRQRHQRCRRTRSMPTAPSSSGPASRSARRSRSTTSTACRRRRTGARSRRLTPAIGGWKVLGYTAQFGNGFSATIAAEMRRTVSMPGISNDGGQPLRAAIGGFQAPDIVANLRVDQAWGSAQIMAAAHQVNALYYGCTA